MKVKCQIYTILTTMHLTISDGVTHFVLHYIQLFLRKKLYVEIYRDYGCFYYLYLCTILFYF